MELKSTQIKQLGRIMSDTLGLEMKDDDLMLAAYAVAKFVCVKELREYKLSHKKE